MNLKLIDMKRRNFLQALGLIAASPVLFKGTPISEIEKIELPKGREKIEPVNINDYESDVICKVYNNKNERILSANDFTVNSEFEMIDVSSIDHGYYDYRVPARKTTNIIIKKTINYNHAKLIEVFNNEETVKVKAVTENKELVITLSAYISSFVYIDATLNGKDVELTLTVLGAITAT